MATYTVVVLKEGYSFSSEDGLHKADGTITLVKGDRHKILVDTGSPYDKEVLIQGLWDHNLHPDDIDFVIGTHGHSDHIGNLNLFTKATFIVSYDICKGDTYMSHDFLQDGAYKIDDGLEVIATPGHTGTDVSLVVHNTDKGTIVVAGDLFEKEEDLQDDSIWRAASENPQVHAENRQTVLDMADYIVPGHGKMFAVPKNCRNNGSVCR